MAITVHRFARTLLNFNKNRPIGHSRGMTAGYGLKEVVNILKTYAPIGLAETMG